ncbi:M23 family metallopeptidase [Aequorivita lipolytica]|uniref:M23 family metallopeptidase n=1 Tax=Aequorivita lipolytica TaxID=153267 RepID=A0A5C6YRW8_9FLAO|nr:M23 family metallopeptidase [Aequorivita lipolytica]TXD70269.1 M23 family metallopeptidase [Aequorivita lipolytica]SRX50695.1 Murein DD-endopeptidase MepM [Aequorivita lipolytica]
MTQKEKRAKKFKKKLLHKYRLVILNEETFEERFSFKLNRLNVFVFSILFALFLILTTTFIIAFTPLREYIPGYSSTALKKKATQLAYKTDSLQKILYVNEQYLTSIKKVLTGDVKTVNFNKDSLIEIAKTDPSVLIRTSRKDSLLRQAVAKEDKYNPLIAPKVQQYALFAPVKGTITENYDSQAKHYAVDVVTIKDSPVKAVADGTVIFAEWTVATGYVIILKHDNNLISVYKHNAMLTKEQGETVKAGEVIGTVGNTGELTTGPHLHFELWRDGFPVNPTSFIDFD